MKGWKDFIRPLLGLTSFLDAYWPIVFIIEIIIYLKFSFYLFLLPDYVFEALSSPLPRIIFHFLVFWIPSSSLFSPHLLIIIPVSLFILYFSIFICIHVILSFVSLITYFSQFSFLPRFCFDSSYSSFTFLLLFSPLQFLDLFHFLFSSLLSIFFSISYFIPTRPSYFFAKFPLQLSFIIFFSFPSPSKYQFFHSLDLLLFIFSSFKWTQSLLFPPL